MKYPDRLIPRSHFKRIVTDLVDYFLCRVVIDKALLTPQNGVYSDELLCLDNKELFDYSTNLLGEFMPEDNRIVLIGENKKHFYSYWDFVEEINIPVFGQDFEVDEKRVCFFFPIASLHQKICLPLPSPPKNSGETITANVMHTPTRSNFWHFSVCWKDQKGEFEKYKGSAWQKRICSTMKAYLQEHILVKLPNHFPPPESAYVNNSC